ncbi:MAG: tetratricopeptide repeat protein [Ignavibacteria bacterium]|nr:tetratricopeptide repeat protein [Ignavibacteria bacterium]MDH7528288.1 tetratricopeptide repeat protein [Ignavibacteria bacterium]
MERIKKFINELFELSSRYCGENLINDLKIILEKAEKLEQELLLKVRKDSKDDLKEIDDIRVKFYSDNLLSFCQKNLTEDLYLGYLLELGKICLDFGEVNYSEYVYSLLIHLAENKKKYLSLVAQAYFYRAEVYVRSSRWKLAENDLKKARQIFNEKKDKKGLARVDNLTGIIKSEKGAIKSALKNFNDALSAFSKMKDELWIGIVEMNIGNLKTIQSHWDEAVTHFKRALASFEKLMDLKRLSLVRYNMGMLFKNRGELEAALTEFDRSLEYALEANYYLSTGLAYLGKGDVYAKLEEYAMAMEYCIRAMEVFYKIMDKVGLADTYKIKGIIQRDTSNFEIAETYLLTSLRLSEEIESLLNFAEAAYELGILYRKWNKSDLAKEYLKISEQYFSKLGAKENLERVKIVIDRTNSSK